MKTLSLASAILLLFSHLTNGQRAAFVIGINNYKNGDVLTKCVNDADSVGDLMKSFGFELHADSNLSTTQFKQTLTGWLPIMKKNKDVVIYFSGHGFDISSDQFLEGNNFDEKNFSHLPDMTVDLYYLLDGLKKVESMPDAKLTRVVMFLDACRDFPTNAQMEMVRNLIRLRVPALRNLYVGYAALPGDQASSGVKVAEGGGPNSLFTQALLASIEGSPNGQLTQGINNDIQLRLYKLSNGAQVMQEVKDLASFQFQTLTNCENCIVSVELSHRCLSCDVTQAKELIDTELLAESYGQVASANEGKLRPLGFNADLSESYSGALLESHFAQTVQHFLTRHEYAATSYDLEKSFVVYTFKYRKLRSTQLYLHYRDASFYDKLAQALSINQDVFPGMLFLGSLGDRALDIPFTPPSGRGIVFGRLAQYSYAILEFGQSSTIMHDPDQLYKFEKVFQKLEIPTISAYRFAKK